MVFLQRIYPLIILATINQIQAGEDVTYLAMTHIQIFCYWFSTLAELRNRLRMRSEMNINMHSTIQIESQYLTIN